MQSKSKLKSRVLRKTRLTNTNFRLSQISPFNSECSPALAPPLSMRSTISRNKIYQSFQFHDQVTFRRIKANNLNRRSEGHRNVGLMGKSRKILWAEQACIQEKEQNLQDMEIMMKCLEELKGIKSHRNYQLLANWNKNKYRRRQQKQLENSLTMISDISASEKNISNKKSIQKTILRRKKTSEKIKKKVYELNVEEFRKYFYKEQPFNAKSVKMLQAATQNIGTQHQFQTLNAFEEEQENKEEDKQQTNDKENRRFQGLTGMMKSKKNKGIVDKSELKFMNSVKRCNEELESILRMRIRHETQFNWQISTKKRNLKN